LSLAAAHYIRRAPQIAHIEHRHSRDRVGPNCWVAFRRAMVEKRIVVAKPPSLGDRASDGVVETIHSEN
jgi:hypothetical protein